MSPRPRLPPRLSEVRGRLNHLAFAVGEGREFARESLIATREIHDEMRSMNAQQEAFSHRLGQLADRMDAISQELDRLQSAQADQGRSAADSHSEVLTGLRRIHASESWHRRALRELRTTDAYGRAYTDPEPLVSVMIATHSRLDLLRSRAIPSILAQEYRNFEIVIVGDQAPYGFEEITEGFTNAPIQFINLPMRGPYPEDHERLWMVGGTPPFNEALHRSRGSWLAYFADDDEMRPNHLRVLLESARERRLELVYGKLQDHYLDEPLGAFPPRWGQIGMQAAIMHSALRLFELELSDADFRMPNDQGLVDRMLRAGVRFGMVDEVVADYYPSLRGLGGEPTPSANA